MSLSLSISCHVNFNNRDDARALLKFPQLATTFGFTVERINTKNSSMMSSTKAPSYAHGVTCSINNISNSIACAFMAQLIVKHVCSRFCVNVWIFFCGAFYASCKLPVGIKCEKIPALVHYHHHHRSRDNIYWCVSSPFQARTANPL